MHGTTIIFVLKYAVSLESKIWNNVQENKRFNRLAIKIEILILFLRALPDFQTVMYSLHEKNKHPPTNNKKKKKNKPWSIKMLRRKFFC